MTETSLMTADGSGRMFDRIARRYDLLNRINSLGLDKGWRRKTVASLGTTAGHRVLDLATGTADLPLEILRQTPEASVVGLDPSPGMLEVGREKVSARFPKDKIELVEGDAQALPFEDDSFDGITMAFGIRNVPDRARALREMNRVLRPGTKAAILELSEPRSGLLAPFARMHIHVIVPWMGSLLSGAAEYRYLQKSIEAFPSPEDFAGMMREAGFASVSTRSFGFGACVLYVGEASA